MTYITAGTAHEFFLYLPPHLTPHSLGISSEFSIPDKDLAHRIYTILRLKADETVSFFTGKHIITVRLTQNTQQKRLVLGTILSFTEPEPQKHELVAGISFLKKDALESAIYSAAQMGYQTITPVLTAKSRAGYLNDREPERLESIIISACEQAKNGTIPKLSAPITLEQFLNRYKKNTLICFDETGESVATLLPVLSQAATIVGTLIGPEGGFTPQELNLITEYHAHITQLTHTILRSKDVACLGLGIVSCGLHQK